MNELAQNILAYLQENEDCRFKAYQLSKLFRKTTAEIREALIVLGDRIEISVEGKDRVYYVLSEIEAQRRLRKQELMQPRERPKKSYLERLKEKMALERCKELYPFGGNFKSIS